MFFLALHLLLPPLWPLGRHFYTNKMQKKDTRANQAPPGVVVQKKNKTNTSKRPSSEGGQRQIVEEICKHLPHALAAILPRAFVEETSGVHGSKTKQASGTANVMYVVDPGVSKECFLEAFV